jgi:hypothetical protein
VKGVGKPLPRAVILCFSSLNTHSHVVSFGIVALYFILYHIYGRHDPKPPLWHHDAACSPGRAFVYVLMWPFVAHAALGVSCFTSVRGLSAIKYTFLACLHVWLPPLLHNGSLRHRICACVQRTRSTFCTGERMRLHCCRA